MPEVQGTVKAISKSGKGVILKEYESDQQGQDQWFNKGKSFEGAWPTQRDAAVTFTYEQTYDAEGKAKFWVIEAWPTSAGKPAPTNGPTPTDGPVPTKTTGPAPALPAPSGPVPTPPSRENSILFQVCLKAAQEFVLNAEGWGKTPGDVLNVADLYYAQGSRLISGEGLALEGASPAPDGDPGPGEPA